jgi:chromate transporter
VVIIAQALAKLGPSAIQGWLTGAIAVAAVITYLVGVNELLILAAGAGLVLVLRTSIRSDLLALAAVGAGGWATAEVAGTDQISLGRLFLVFLEVGAFLYGSGYVLVAFLQHDLVDQLGVLTQDQLLDAVAIGQLTPGPVFTTATFVGYVLGGLPGAVVATFGIFLPAFLFVAAVTPLVRRVRDRMWTAALLDGVIAAALGLMAGVTLQLSRVALVDLFTVGVAAGAALLMWRTRVNSAWLLLLGGLAGLAAEALGSVPT